MQTQTQTQTGKSKLVKKMIYTSCFIAALSLVIAYVAGTVYFKFLVVDPKTMGTMFYSWRVGGADDFALKIPADKIPKTNSMKKIGNFFGEIVKDKSYPVHLPRLAENHHTFAYPNMDLFYGLRKSVVDKQKSFQRTDSDAKQEYIDFAKTIDSEILLYTEKWEEAGENHVDHILKNYYASLKSEQKDIFVNSVIDLIELFTKLSSEKSYAFTDVTPSENAVKKLSTILSNFTMDKNKTDNSNLIWFIQNNKDAEIFLKSLKINNLENKESFTKALSSAFFNSLTSGVLYPYFSYGYSTALNTLLYLCLDMNNLEYEKNPDIKADNSIKNIMIEQKVASNKIEAFGSAIAYGIAKGMSPNEEIGENTVKKSRNPFVFFLFTSKLATPSEETEKNLKKIIKHLIEKKKLIENLDADNVNYKVKT